MRLFRLLFALALTAAPALTRASTWEIDPAQSRAQFAVRNLLVTKVRGTLGAVTGVLKFDPHDPTRSTIEASVDAAGVDTRDAERDAHLRSPDFLDAATYPAITFKSTTVERVGADHFTVTGDLTLHGVTKPVTLDVTGPVQALADPSGHPRVRGSASTRLNRTDFGIGGGPMIGRDVEVTIDVEVIRK